MNKTVSEDAEPQTTQAGRIALTGQHSLHRFPVAGSQMVDSRRREPGPMFAEPAFKVLEGYGGSSE
jgi:hypothetical protein